MVLVTAYSFSGRRVDLGSSTTDKLDFGRQMTLNGVYAHTGDVVRHERRAYACSSVEPSFLLWDHMIKTRLNAFLGSSGWCDLVQSASSGVGDLITGNSSMGEKDYVYALATTDDAFLIGFRPPGESVTDSVMATPSKSPTISPATIDRRMGFNSGTDERSESAHQNGARQSATHLSNSNNSESHGKSKRWFGKVN
jgi:hypothetical protein